MTGPVVLCGLGSVGWRILDNLVAAGLEVVVVDNQIKPTDPRLNGIRLINGDCRDELTLREAGISSAQGALVVTSDDLVNVTSALLIRKLAPNARIVVRMYNQNLLSRLGKTVENMIALSVSGLAAPLLAVTATTAGVIGTFALENFRHQIIEVAIDKDSIFLNREIRTLGTQNITIVGYYSASTQQTLLLNEIPINRILSKGDRLIISGEPNEIRRFLEPANLIDSDILWAGKIRRFARVAYRTLNSADISVKIGTAVFVSIVITSACIYHWGLGLSWPDGVYRTISVIATGSDMGGKDYEGWAKVFVSMLRIIGTIVVAAFTAILTNFLIRARLRGALEVRKVPDGGHIVVIGLGNVGFRAVEELIALGEQPVVIELKGDTPHVATCRRKGVPVFLGDATVMETLKQAKADSAKAVIAVTPADLTNLEIALLVAELNPFQRIVVRLAETTLAATAREAAGVRLALSLPDLVGPAFLAGLLGERVLTLFLLDSRFVAVLELSIIENDPLVNRSLRSLQIDYNIIPVALNPNREQFSAPHPDIRLREGDHVILMAALSDIRRISSRELPPKVWGIEILGFPLTARQSIEIGLRALHNLNQEQASQIVNQTPFTYVEHRTRGEIEDFLHTLTKEKIQVRIYQQT